MRVTGKQTLRVLLALCLLGGVALYASSARRGGAQSTLPRQPLSIETAQGVASFTVEVATTRQQQERGLMFRTSLQPDEGMLFDYGAERQASLWMKNTLLPLDMVFIAADGTIVRVAAGAKPRSEDSILSYVPVRAVLEIMSGRAAELDIRSGNRVLNPIFGTAPKGNEIR